DRAGGDRGAAGVVVGAAKFLRTGTELDDAAGAADHAGICESDVREAHREGAAAAEQDVSTGRAATHDPANGLRVAVEVEVRARGVGEGERSGGGRRAEHVVVRQLDRACINLHSGSVGPLPGRAGDGEFASAVFHNLSLAVALHVVDVDLVEAEE